MNPEGPDVRSSFAAQLAQLPTCLAAAGNVLVLKMGVHGDVTLEPLFTHGALKAWHGGSIFPPGCRQLGHSCDWGMVVQLEQ